MRTFAAHKADLERDRYADAAATFDAKTTRGAKAILAQHDAKMLSRQSIAQLARGDVALTGLPAPEHVVLAMQTLKLVDITSKDRVVSLTGHARRLAGLK